MFLGYARQVLEQAALITEKYTHQSGGKQEFCVSTQHYSFAVNAFVDLIQVYGSDNYDFSLRETQTYEIIDDVARLKSEIGILYLNEFNETVLRKILKSNDLQFTELFEAKPHIFISDKILLHKKQKSPWQTCSPIRTCLLNRVNTTRFTTLKKFSAQKFARKYSVRDRATLFNLLIGLNGYTICSGVIDEELNGENIVAIPLAENGRMHIGYITKKHAVPSRLGSIYLDALKRYAKNS